MKKVFKAKPCTYCTIEACPANENYAILVHKTVLVHDMSKRYTGILNSVCDRTLRQPHLKQRT